MRIFKSTALLITLLLVNLSVRASGIPVVDGAHITTDMQNQIQTWTLEAKRWADKVTQFKQDFDNQTKQLASMTGVRNIGDFMNEAGSILDQVKDLDKWIKNSSRILNSGKDILAPELRKIFDSYGLTNLCDGYADKQ